MKKGFLLLLSAALAVGTASWAKAPQPKTTQYEVKLKSEAFGDLGTRKMWIKGENMRWEYMAAGLPLKLVKNKQGVFLIHPWNKTAAKYPEGTNRSNPLALFPGPTGPVNDFLKSVKAAKRGTEKVGKELCTVYTYTEPVDKKSCRIWISAKSGSPVKLTIKGTRGKSDPITATYARYTVGASVSDTLFQLPKGYNIRPMPSSSLTSGIQKGKSGKDPI